MLALRLQTRLMPIPLRIPGESSLVVAGTGAFFLAALAYILRFSVNAPVVDEWDLTHVVLGGMTFTEWSFTRLNEHLFIPANAIWYGVMKLSGLDFRAGMIVNLLLHTSAAIILMRAARHLRGRNTLADLILPAALLHWGHAYNLLMSYQIAFGFFALSAAVMLDAIASAEAGQERRTAIRASLALLLLMLSGGMGIAFVPVLGLWIVVLAWRSRSVWPFCILALAGVYTAYALLAAPKVSATPTDAIPLGRLLWCMAQYLGIGTGLWYDGPHWTRNGIIIASAYLLVTMILAVVTLRRRDGGRTAGFLCFLLGHFAIALGIAVSRGGGIAERYVTISAIGVAAAYLGLVSCWPDWARHVGIVLAVALFAINVGPGQRYGHGHRALYRHLERDLRSGMPAEALVAKYAKALRVGDNLMPALLRLKTHHIREFNDLQMTEK